MISYDAKRKLFVLETKNTTTLISAQDDLRSLYWGASICAQDVETPGPAPHSSFDPDLGEERAEYPVFNARMFTEPCLMADENGQSALFFNIEGHEVKGNTLTVFLREERHSLALALEYTVFEKYDLMGRRAVLTNNGKPITVQRFFSGCCTIPPRGELSLRHLCGSWAGECRLNDAVLQTGVTVLQSKRGIPGPHFNPSFALSSGATETAGEVWFGLLAYSGNWKLCVEKTVFGNVRVMGGRNDFDASETLGMGETLQTPMLYCGFSAEGFGGMSRLLHDFQMTELVAQKEPLPVLYNSWEATAFAVDVNSQKKLARRAAEMGVELFVVDDGWFGRRNSDSAGLGDWEVNPEKFPNGLGELIDEVKRLGMEFGIWVEPEAVNPDSDLFRAHPDWIYSIPGVEPMTARNQYVLDFSLPEVKQYVKGFLQALLTRHDIRFLKWDMNRPLTDVYSADGKNGRRRRGHVENLYEIWAWLRQEFPLVKLESCSGGGGRVDMGILRWASTFWPSDNTDPYERLFIQEGFTQFYAPGTMTCWVTDTPEKGGRPGRCDTAYKFYSAMCGPLGIGSDIGLLDESTVAEYKKYISQYKQIRRSVQLGALYRLSSPSTGLCAVQYSFEGQVVVLAFLHSQRFGQPVLPLRLQKLDADKRYRLEGGQSFAGSTLMNRGLELPLQGDFNACCFVFETEEPE